MVLIFYRPMCCGYGGLTTRWAKFYDHLVLIFQYLVHESIRFVLDLLDDLNKGCLITSSPVP